MVYERIQKSSGQSSSQKKHTPLIPPLSEEPTQTNSQSSHKVNISALPNKEERDAIKRKMLGSFTETNEIQSEIPESSSVAKTSIQAKLTIGAPGDKYEQEADRVAAQVVNFLNAPVTQQKSQNLQREAIPEEEEKLQMKQMLQLQAGVGGVAASPDLESSIQQARSGGQPLADHVRKPMERAFGTDFSGVKVHTDRQSDQLNRAVQAKAFTTGQDVFFRSGEYNPGSRGGQELLAHELTHVVQQNSEVVQRVYNTPEEQRYQEATLSGSPKDQLLNELITKLGFTEHDSVAKIFKSICDDTRSDSYAGSASALQAALRSRVWNCQSLASLLIEICQKLRISRTAKLDSIGKRKISIERVFANLAVFGSGNVIDKYNNPSQKGLTRISFESHTRALIDDTLYDPLMGLKGEAANKIWEYEVEENGNIVGLPNSEYEKTKQRHGPIFIGIMKTRVASTA
ncbi:MAG: DUF4157 domain-containing protein [Rhizonema sp. NSF051]|nr:DUF4157 domain-containing protein [Rhizonema sp. NSF051]